MQPISGKTVVITGASRGIGEATARIFAKAGARVALLARSTQSLSQIVSEIGDGARAYVCDVANWDQVQTAVGRITKDLGEIDILINNAGIIDPVASIHTAGPEHWSRIIDVNLKGPFYMTRAILPAMRARKSGTILNISSGAALHALEGWSGYCASKAGLLMFTRSLDHEYRASGIRAIGLSPGTVATQMQREVKASGVGPVAQLNWDDHIAPEWPAKALLWMCGDEADPWLGQDISLREPAVRQAVGLT